MPSSHEPFFQATWNTPDGKPPERCRRRELGEERCGKFANQPATKEDKLSPPPPVSPRNGESGDQPAEVESTQPFERKELAATPAANAADNFHHQHDAVAESEIAPADALRSDGVDEATASEDTSWGDVAAALRDLGGGLSQGDHENEVVKAERRNTQKLTDSEEDRFLTCLSLGLSLRQAAHAVGCHHTTMVKRAKRDEQFARRIAKARSHARTDPLLEVTQAARRSWRAAAWLLTYLDRRDNRGRPKDT